jgi:acetolactate synthase-1/2/3 large subunit
LAHSDLLIAVGTRFSDRVTGNVNAFAPDTKVIHIDIDPAEIGKNHSVNIPIVGDARGILAGIAAELLKVEATPHSQAWLEEIAQVAAAEKTSVAKVPKELPISSLPPSSQPICPESAQPLEAITASSDLARLNTLGANRSQSERQAINRQLPDSTAPDGIQPYDLLSRLNLLLQQSGRDVIITTDVGQHQMWAAQYLDIAEPRHFISSGGLGTMGFGLPAALGAQIANPGSMVVCISGDGSIQMNSQELATAAVNSLPVKVVLLNNGSLGMVRQWQQLFCDRRYACTLLEENPDFVKLAEAYNWKGYRVTQPDELPRALEWLLTQSLPALLDVRIATEQLVLPMVVPGEALGRVIDWGDV